MNWRRIDVGNSKLGVCGPRGLLASDFVSSIASGSRSDVQVSPRLVVAIGVASWWVLDRLVGQEMLLVIKRQACGRDRAVSAVHRRF